MSGVCLRGDTARKGGPELSQSCAPQLQLEAEMGKGAVLGTEGPAMLGVAFLLRLKCLSFVEDPTKVEMTVFLSGNHPAQSLIHYTNIPEGINKGQASCLVLESRRGIRQGFFLQGLLRLWGTEWSHI